MAPLARTAFEPFRMMEDLLRWDPFRQLSQIVPERFAEPGYVPRFDVKETQDAYVFHADLPGVREEDLEISLTGNLLTLSGKREEEKREEGERYYAYERSWGSFTRSFTLPEGIDPEGVEAQLASGVLTVRVPKRAEARPRKISLVDKLKKAVTSEKTAKA